MKKALIVSVSLLAAASLVAAIVLSKSVDALVPGINTLISVNNSSTGPSTASIPDTLAPSSLQAPISADGRYVAYYSYASDLVLNDTNGKSDVFVRDTKNNSTSRVNTSISGVQANAGMPTTSNGSNNLSNMQQVAISGTGRYVAFISGATNLIDGQTIQSYLSNQVYLKDTKTNEIKIVSKTSTGALGNGINNSRPSPMYVKAVSDDGRFVLWGGYKNLILEGSSYSTTGVGYVYLSDLKNNTFKRITSPAGYPDTSDVATGWDASMSCDGSIIAFTSNLQFDSSDTNLQKDLFIVDIRNDFSISRVTNSNIGISFANVSCNGRFITFTTPQSGLSPSVPSSNYIYHGYIYDRISDETTLIDKNSSSVVGNADINSISVDDKGNVAFSSKSTNLISGSTSPSEALFLRNHNTGLIEVLSRNMYGAPMTVKSPVPSISSDGKFVSYPTGTIAAPMFPGATNNSAVVMSETGL